jgi:hypothetical protein
MSPGAGITGVEQAAMDMRRGRDLGGWGRILCIGAGSAGGGLGLVDRLWVGSLGGSGVWGDDLNELGSVCVNGLGLTAHQDQEPCIEDGGARLSQQVNEIGVVDCGMLGELGAARRGHLGVGAGAGAGVGVSIRQVLWAEAAVLVRVPAQCVVLHGVVRLDDNQALGCVGYAVARVHRDGLCAVGYGAEAAQIVEASPGLACWWEACCLGWAQG